MSNAFTNFLNGLFDPSGASMRDYQHADRLYVKNNYARSPKVGFLYFINFNINPNAILDPSWKAKGSKDVGLLVKKADLPKFTISSETLNQYNRKTVVQTKITYNNISIDFHDDNNDITNDLWKNYYQYYYIDSVYGSLGSPSANGTGGISIISEYADTKFGNQNYAYGLDNFQQDPFFKSIDIYVLHKGHGAYDFTQITLVNPLVVDWVHDSLNQEENGKVLSNKMTLAYETVVYNKGKIVRNHNPPGFAPVYYDFTPSPLKVGGSGNIFGPGGILAGANSIFGADGLLQNASSPLDYLGVFLQTKNLVKNISNLKSSNVSGELYSVGAGVLSGAIGTALSQPFSSTNNGGQGNNGITLYNNNSVDGAVAALPIRLTKKGG
jgi:hypothetical protein